MNFDVSDDLNPLRDEGRRFLAAPVHADRVTKMEFNPAIPHANGSGLTIAGALATLKAL